jgi:hypothetical protein
MRRTLGSLVLSAALAAPVLAGCGDGGAERRAEDSSSPTPTGSTSMDSATPSESSSSPTPTSPSGTPAPGEAVAFTEVALISQTAAGGETDSRPTILGNRAAVGRFTSQFESDTLAGRLLAAIRKTDLPPEHRFAAAVVSIGCDVPPGVTVQAQDDGLAIVPMKVKSPLQECLAPVTTVALVTIDREVL